MIAARPSSPRLRVAFGPEMRGWGSWDWLGADTADALGETFDTSFFSWGEIPDCDVVVVVKHILPGSDMRWLADHCALIYCPVDHYGATGEIHDDGASLRCCSKIVVHCRRLWPYFERFASTEYLDHQVKFVSGGMLPYRDSGPVLWIGVTSNLPALVDWLNTTDFDEPLLVLSNFEGPALPLPEEIGLRGRRDVTVRKWTPERHRLALGFTKAAIDIKGGDFRQAHKPPAKAFDYLASGLPLAMNESSTVEHLAEMGFEIAAPLDTRRWFSRDYWRETAAFGAAVRELLSLERIVSRWKRLILDAFWRRGRIAIHNQAANSLQASL